MPENTADLLLVPPVPSPGQRLTWSGLHGSALALAIVALMHKRRGVAVVVLDDQRQLDILRSDLGFYLAGNGAPGLHEFPAWECLPYDNFSPHPDLVSRRLRLLSTLPGAEHAIVLTTTANLMQRLPPVEFILGHTFSLKVGDTVDIDGLRERLAGANYESVSQVLAPGEFAVRGGLVDVFPMGAAQPFRIDLFDDEIESIRHFDPDTQRSSDTVAGISLLPAREFPFTEASVKTFRQAFRREFEGDPRRQKVYTDVSNDLLPQGVEFFFPLFFDATATLFDYLPGDTLWLAYDDLADSVATIWAEIQDRHTNANYDPERKVLPPEQLYLDPRSLLDPISADARITLRSSRGDNADWVAPSQPLQSFPVDARAESPYGPLLNHLSGANHRVLITCETMGRREAMEAMLGHHGVRAWTCDDFSAFLETDNPAPALCVYPLERGLRLPDGEVEVITESQLYGEKVFQRRRRETRVQDPEAIIRSLAELHIGDPVVHIEHGVGRYAGLTSLDINDEATEFLVIEYQNGDKLYVPVLSLNLISRFIGGSAEHAPLHRLGGDQWDRARKRAREKAYDVAAELLEIDALRTARPGNALDVPEEEYALFVERFPFEETPDQQRAIDEVVGDLRSGKPMDRLVCGDVGFGKTEVALRAAFVAVHNNCQVAILVPTTLLAQQHYQTFIDRFADMSISVELLSRFKTKKQAAELVDRLKQGYPDIVIGTHRLLQDDIRFRNLGLLIIDEEHRFGVRQKEKIKRLRSQVDIITLTATPIPRTLNITMSGLRAISIIATPPEMRLSIKTFVREWSRGLIREACLREIRRGGQVYFLHNDVRTIERAAMELAELVPEAKIDIGHGQMGELQLERVMQDFYHQRFNILVCSTIIESGIDIPSANTIIINRADRFGLAQLHQLRGRVGRSHHQAFAYLLIPGQDMITANARKRLEAIDSMEDLGAGFALASHDLEIRGAGELLGETQSGLIDDVGFSLYSEYLAMAVKSIRENRLPPKSDDDVNAGGAVVDLHVPALFPADYLANPHTRLIMYKRIASAVDNRELEELQVETIDRFGLMPDPARNLFRLTALRLQGERLGLRRIDVGPRGGALEFVDNPPLDASVILSLVHREPRRYRLSGPSTLEITAEFDDAEERLAALEQLLDGLERESMG